MSTAATKSILFRTRDELLRIRVSQIAYFKAERSYTHLYMTQGPVFVFAINLGSIAQILERQLAGFSPMFMRVGKSLIVNKAYILHINVSRQKLKLGPFGDRMVELEVSKEALRNLKEMFEEKLIRPLNDNCTGK